MAIARAWCTCKTCGQEFEVRVRRNNSSEAKSFEKWAVDHIDECPDCEEKRLREAHDAENAAAAEKAAEAGLPQLTGSAKQIAWAETIRMKIVTGLTTINPKYHPFMLEVGKAAVRIMTSETKASWWIDNRVYADADFQSLMILLRRKCPEKYDAIVALLHQIEDKEIEIDEASKALAAI